MNYLVLVGAPKCGTTTLASWLGGMPDAVLSEEKETLFFTDFADRKWGGPGAYSVEQINAIPRTFEAFQAQFSANSGASLRIEASTDNLSCGVAAENIARLAERKGVENVWVVAILRDPIQRIISEFEHTLRLGWQSGSLLNSLQAENERIANVWHPLFWHVHRSRYATQLARYRHLFGEQMFVMDYHRLNDPAERARLLRFIRCPDELAESPLERQNERQVLARPIGVRLLKDERLKSMGRALVPKGIRPTVKRLITGGPIDRYQPNAKEIKFIQSALSDEIGACIEASDIPTEFWDVALSMKP